MLGFENYYFAAYRDYLLNELRGANADRLDLTRRLGQVIYRDGEVAAELRALAGRADTTLPAPSARAAPLSRPSPAPTSNHGMKYE
jgi:hypothetical protein